MRNEIILQATGLSKEFDLQGSFLNRLLGRAPDTVRAVDNVNLVLRAGEGLALVGESGSGKTTLGKLITRLQSASAGKILFQDEDVTFLKGSKLKAFRRQVQMIFQNPYELLDPRETIAAAVCEPLRIHKVGTRSDHLKRVAQLLGEVELKPADRFIGRLPKDLSGGQLQRVSIARALALAPRLIVADEAVSMLDVSVRSGIMKLLLELQQQLGVAYLYITHDLAVARHMSSRIAVMYLGAIVEEGATDAVINAPAHPYTRMLVAAVPEHRAGRKRQNARAVGEVTGLHDVPDGCRFHPRCPLATDLCRSTEPPEISVGSGRWARCHFAHDVAAGRTLSDGVEQENFQKGPL